MLKGLEETYSSLEAGANCLDLAGELILDLFYGLPDSVQVYRATETILYTSLNDIDRDLAEI